MEMKNKGNEGMREVKGVVSSVSGNKSIVVTVNRFLKEPKYGKYIRRSADYHAHDEACSAKVGDLVSIIESRPLSRKKNWKMNEIITAA